MLMKVSVILAMIIGGVWFGSPIILDTQSFPKVEFLCSGKPFPSGMTFVRNEEMERLGKCYGYIDCRACSTCEYCKHCNSGGSCGVCAGGHSFRRRIYIPEPKPEVRSNEPEVRRPRPIAPPAAMLEADKMESSFIATIQGDRVNLREYPTVLSDVKSQLDKLSRPTIISRTPYRQSVASHGEDYWYKVACGGTEGWVFGGLLAFNEERSSLIPTEKMELIIIDRSKVNVRGKPASTADRLFQLQQGDRISVIRRTSFQDKVAPYGWNYWYLIAYEGFEGWVFGGVIGK